MLLPTLNGPVSLTLVQSSGEHAISFRGTRRRVLRG
jgi:hypothetical protein